MTLILGSDHVTGSVPNASVVFNNGTFILNTPFDMPTASPMTITQTIYENHFGNDINVNGFGGLVILAGVYTYTDNSNNGNVPSGQMNPTLSSANDNFINELNVIDNRRGINIGISGGTGSTNPSGGIVQMGNGSSTSFFLPGNPLTTYISLEQNSILALDYSNSGPTYVNTIIAGGPTGTSDVQESLATAGTGTVIFHQGHIVVTQQQYYDGTTQIDSGATLQLGDGTMGDTVLTSAGVISSQTSGGDGDIMQSGQTVSVTDTTKTGTSPQAGHFSTSVGTSANRIINNGRIVVDNVNATLLSNLSGTGTLTQAGAGTTTLGPSISYMGATLIAGGTLAITSGSSLASSSSVTISSAGRSSLVAVPYSAANTNVATVGAPVLDVSQAGSQTVSNLGGDATARIFLGANNLTINSSASTVFGGQVADGGIAGGTGGGLTKTGPSTFTLSNADTYTGGTTISAGKLIIANTSGTATGSGPVSVLNTATLAGGGSIGGSLQTSSGSQMSPGSAANSVLAVGGAASFASGTTFNVALATPNVGGGLDGNVLISVAGSLTLGNATIWNVTVGPTFAVGTYDLIDYGGALSDPNGFTNWAFAGLPSGDVFHVQNATDGSLNSIQLDVTAVPEPRWPLVYLAGLGLFALPRPRRLRHE
jgi:autotransporter-associated beta strand protein